MYIPNPMSFISLNVFPNIATQWPLRQLRTIQFTDSRDVALRSMEKQRHMTCDIGSLGCVLFQPAATTAVFFENHNIILIVEINTSFEKITRYRWKTYFVSCN